jgi:hypothetical protein
MSNLLKLSAAAGVLIGLVACEETSNNKLNVGGDDNAAACKVTNSTLAGTSWLYNKLAADGSGTREPDVQTRATFFEEGGVLKAKYTVGSYSDVYTYDCKLNEKLGEWQCFEPPKYKDWCQALITGGGTCDAAALTKLAGNFADAAAIDKAIPEATETVAKYKDGEQWEQFVFNNNNLGNKLQGRMYVKVDEKRCHLRVTDNYMTIYNAQMKEDSNPVGTDQFVQTEEDFMWETCTDSADLIAMKSDKFPEKEEEVLPCLPNAGCGFGAGEPVYYHYIGTDGREAKEGCTYSYDLYVDWKPVSKDNEAPVVEFGKGKEVRWGFSQTYDEPKAHIAEIVRYATCEGKKEQVETACNLVLVQ